ncbi:MAG: glycosyltransferase family 4 protein [Phycisphaerales bacterium]|nr:glycosyltransferase family 4 protein [Phycisphaerales bacterium]
MPARVLINSKWKTHQHTTGVQRYASELINALGQTGMVFDEAAPQPGRVWRTTLWEQRVLPKLAEKYDTLVCPANMAPMNLSPDVNLILTVHCLRFHFHPENYTRSFVNWYRFMIPRIIERADTILTVSNTAAEQITDIYPQAKGKVEVLHPGVSPVFCPQGITGDRAVSIQPYWVFIGNAAPAKNLKILLEALSISKKGHRLVLLGVTQEQLDAMGVAYPRERVLALGHINNTTRVASILRGAIGLLAPSLYESFDLPTVEAMACGCTVLASDIPVHREIAQDAPLYIPASDASRWAYSMDQILTGSLSIEHHQELGINRASRFRWEQAARELVDIINRTP